VENAVSSVYFYNLDDKKFTFLNDKNSLNINGHGLPSGDSVTSSNFFSQSMINQKTMQQVQEAMNRKQKKFVKR